MAGYEKAYRERGLDPRDFLHGTRAEYFTHPFDEWVRHPLKRELQRHPEITAVLLPNDSFATQAYALCESEHIRIPEELSLIGFDDTIAVHNPNLADHLTTVRVPLHAIGEQAARLLMQRIHGEMPMDVSLTLPTELMVRKSTAAPRLPTP